MYLVRYTAQDEFAGFTGIAMHETLAEAQADADAKNAAMKEDSRHWAAFALVPAAEAPLTIPETIALVIEPYEFFGPGCLRIEARQATGVGQFADFGEVAYWHPNGTNDIMRGETGTLVQAAQALVDFTAQG